MEEITKYDILNACSGFDKLFKNVQEIITRLNIVHWKVDDEILLKTERDIITAIGTLEALIILGKAEESSIEIIKDTICIGYAVYGLFEISMSKNKPEHKDYCEQHIALADIAFAEFAKSYGMITEWKEFHNAIGIMNESAKPDDNLAAN